MDKEKIVELYPDLAKHSKLWVEELYKSICNEQLIHEFIAKTINADKTIETLNTRLKGKYARATLDGGDNSIVITYKGIFDLDEVNEFMNTFGWFPAYISGYGSYQKYIKSVLPLNLTHIVYQAKYDSEAVNKDKYLYHLTPDIVYSSVRMKGLTPKSHSKIANHPERIYLMNPADDENYLDLAEKLWDRIKNEKTKFAISDYYLLKIDLGKLSNHKFYNDPQFMMANGAVWTYQNIPSNAITVEDKIMVNPNPVIPDNFKTADKVRNKFKANL